MPPSRPRLPDQPALRTRPPAATPTENGDTQAFLFVQLAEAGTWLPNTDEPGVYTLTLTGASEQTLFFSDRPERIVGPGASVVLGDSDNAQLSESGFTPGPS